MADTMGAMRISEDWLSRTGWKWEQHDRQPTRHWLLWIGGACVEYNGWRNDHDSLGVEIANMGDRYPLAWYCWLRSDIAGRYSRIVHVRTVHFIADLERMIEGLTGRQVAWGDVIYGALRFPLEAERMREEANRLDQRINQAWVQRVDAELGVSEIEKAKLGVKLP